MRAAAGSASTRDTPAHGIEVLERTSENITAAFSDDYMKANADFRNRAGLDTYIERRDDGKCCAWCSKIAGRYSYPDKAPRDIFRRHDNCVCTVEYVCSKGRQDVWSKRWRDEQGKAERIAYADGAGKPVRYTPEQAKELEKRLTSERESGRIKNIESGNFNAAEQVYKTLKGEKLVIHEDVINKIYDTLEELNSRRIFDDVIIIHIDPEIVMQTDPVKKGTFFDIVLNLNDSFLGGKTVEQIDRELLESDFTVANSLREAVIHEIYHAKLINGLNQGQLDALYEILSEYHIDGISQTAWKDGSECIAEVGVLLERGEINDIPQEAKNLFNKYLGGLI